MGPCVFNTNSYLVTIVRISVLYPTAFTKSKVWLISHSLGSGHETMVCTVYLAMFLWYSYSRVWVRIKINEFRICLCYKILSPDPIENVLTSVTIMSLCRIGKKPKSHNMKQNKFKSRIQFSWPLSTQHILLVYRQFRTRLQYRHWWRIGNTVALH